MATSQTTVAPVANPIAGGDLARLVEDDGVAGVTSNPSMTSFFPWARGATSALFVAPPQVDVILRC
jgi:hypothetical protein